MASYGDERQMRSGNIAVFDGVNWIRKADFQELDRKESAEVSEGLDLPDDQQSSPAADFSDVGVGDVLTNLFLGSTDPATAMSQGDISRGIETGLRRGVKKAVTDPSEVIPTHYDLPEAKKNLGGSIGRMADTVKNLFTSPIDSVLAPMDQAMQDPAIVSQMTEDMLNPRKIVREEPAEALLALFPFLRAAKLGSNANKLLGGTKAGQVVASVIDRTIAALDPARGGIALPETLKEGIDALSLRLARKAQGKGDVRTDLFDEMKGMVDDPAAIAEIERVANSKSPRKMIPFESYKEGIPDALRKAAREINRRFGEKLKALPNISLGESVNDLRWQIDDFLAERGINRWVDGGGFSFEKSDFGTDSPARKKLNAAGEDIDIALSTGDTKALYTLKQQLGEKMEDIEVANASRFEGIITGIEDIIDTRLSEVLGEPFDNMNATHRAARNDLFDVRDQTPLNTNGQVDTGRFQNMMEDAFFDNETSSNKRKALEALQGTTGFMLLPQAAGLVTDRRLSGGTLSKGLQVVAYTATFVKPIAGLGASIARIYDPKGMRKVATQRNLSHKLIGGFDESLREPLRGTVVADRRREEAEDILSQLGGMQRNLQP